MSGVLWTFGDFIAGTGGESARAAAPHAISGISIDSRSVAAGDAFFAIAGDRFDGHDFAAAALAAGAATAVVARDRQPAVEGSGHLTVVDDVMDALRALARAARARSDARIVAVTGSVGKTGTKDMLAAAIGAAGPVHSSPASFNNHWGVPLTLARMPTDVPAAIFEIGMNHAGEIEPLARMVRPHVAIVTTVEPVHMAYFDDLDELTRAKGEIFAGLEAGGTALINRDNPQFESLRDIALSAGVTRVAGFGDHGDAEVRLRRVCLKEACSTVSADVFGEEVTYKLGSPGRHIVQNSLAVLGAVAAIDGDLAHAALALARLQPPAGRGRRYGLQVDRGTATLIDESYNANPASMASAIELLARAEPGRGGRRIAVLGDMLELGEDSASLHAGLAAPLAAAGADLVFAAGPLMEALWNALPTGVRGGYAETASGLERQLLASLLPGDVIMVKGSNGSRLGPLVDAMRARFDPEIGAEPRQQESA